jgi:L-fuculose-phosphate aldolase
MAATNNLWRLKQEMCEIGQRIWQKGFCAGNEGNHSVRLGDNRVLCTCTGVSKGFLKPEMLCVVDMDGNPIERNSTYQPSSEVKIHLAIYKHRPDVKAVIHSHPPHATAFAIAGVPVPEGIHPEAEIFLGRVPTAEYATPSTAELAERLLPHIGPQTNTVLMGNHGSVSFSDTLIDAYYRLEILDAYCKVLLLCRQIGPPNVLSPEQMTELLTVKQQFGMQDERLACAPDGCVGQFNAPFFAQFDVQPAGAACDGEGNVVQRHDAADGDGSQPIDEAQFETMVQAITDQIMAGAVSA